MNGKIVRFSYLARRRRLAAEAEQNLSRKPWLFRLLDKTAAPFWFARVRRTARYRSRDLIAFKMLSIPSMFFRIEVRGLTNFKYEPSTIIACGHKRDLDVPIIVGQFYSLFRPRRYRKHLKMLYVATRDDIFERGFLTTYFPMLDRLRPVLGRIRLDWFFGGLLQGCPVKLPDEQTVNQLLHETLRIEGNTPAAEAFEEEWEERLLGEDASRGGVTLKHAIFRASFEALSQYSSARMFAEPLASRIRQRHRELMAEQLHYMTRILDKGGTLLVLPEGRVTPDGRFCKMRAAVIRLVLQTRVEPRLLPVNITYDFMDTWRPSTTLIVGPEQENLKNLSKQQLTDLIRKKVATLACVTLSGLVSRWLVTMASKEISPISLSQLREELWAEAQRLRELGLPLDRQLATRQEFEQRFERFLAYAHKAGNIFQATNASEGSADSATIDGLLLLDRTALLREECAKHSDNPVRYCYNELTELLEAYDALPHKEATTEELFEPLPLKARRLTAG